MLRGDCRTRGADGKDHCRTGRASPDEDRVSIMELGWADGKIQHHVGFADRDEGRTMTSHVAGSVPEGKASGPETWRQKPGTPSLLRELNDRAALDLKP